MRKKTRSGLGFPIGGVAALDYEKGGLSPGGIGFDINCLPSKTKILTEYGYWKNIEDFDKEIKERLISFNTKIHKLESSKILFFIKKKANKLIKLRTEMGNVVLATEDHPLLTRNGMKEAVKIEVGEEVSVFPFDGVKYEEPNDEIIVSEKEIRSIVGDREKIIKELKVRNLLPLRMNNEKLPILAKLIGFITGDGCISRRKYRNRKYVYWSTHAIGKARDLKKISEDIKKVGFGCSEIFTQKCESTLRNGKKISGTTRQITANSCSFSVLLLAMGVPEGRKSEKEFSVPGWVKKAPLWIKRLYLAGFFGAELTKPIRSERFGFRTPTLSVNKIEKLVKNGIQFLREISDLLKEFNITTTIAVEREDGTINRNNEKTIRIVLRISNKDLIKLYGKIGYEYNEERTLLSAHALSFLKFKKEFLKRKRSAIKFALKLRKEGWPLQKILQETIIKKFVNRRVLEEWLYRDVRDVRIPRGFSTPEEFIQLRSFNPPSPVVWSKIIEKKIIEKNVTVFDFTVSHPSHNFIADNFVSSNCGVRLLRTNLTTDQIKPKLPQLLDSIFHNVPSGLGSKGKLRVTRAQLQEVLESGARWAVENGYGTEQDLEHIEEQGCMETADAGKISEKAIKRGMPQLGSLGAGNHFLEIQKVDKIFLPDVAKVFGIEKEGQVMTMIHTGSRGFGHQVCTDYLRILENAFRDEIRKLPDRELVYAPAGTRECEDYFKAMSCAANFGFCNRQMIAAWVRESFVKTLGMKLEDIGLELVYGVPHNIAKITEIKVDGEKRKVFLHRKGSTRSLPPGDPRIPKDHRSVGQVVLLPGDLGSASYVLVGVESAKETFYSTAHGAGRVISRTKARRRFRGEQIKANLAQRGILVRSASWKVLAEEAPGVYKNIDEVARVSEEAGIGKRVARLVPLGCVKG